MEFTLTSHKRKDLVILDIEGRLTGGDNLTAFRTAVRDLVAKGQSRIVLNMANVSYMDSAGLGELVMTSRTVTQVVCSKCGMSLFPNENGRWERCPTCKSPDRNTLGQLKIAAVTGPVLDLLQFTRLHGILDVHETVEAAISSFD